MPTYEYECSKGHLFEAEQSIHDPALKRCRICRAKATRLISASSFILKGGGWYSDGYGSSKSGSGKSESSGGESKSESKSETKSESKPQSKPDAKSETKKPSGSSASTGA